MSDATAAPSTRAGDAAGTGARRRASRSLWQACEAVLSAGTDPDALDRALASLQAAFECDGVALYATGVDGALEPWCARGAWRVAPGELRDCVTIPLFRGAERVGGLDLLARPGQRWRADQLGLVRTASGALGAALGTRLELERLRHQPGRDAATGLPDASAFHTRAAEELARARRHGLPLAIALVELDHFDGLTRRYGREVADAVLAETALVIRLALRESDLVSRLEGPRFALTLPETDAGPALRCAERVRRTIEEHRFARVGRVSASAGMAASPRDGLEAVELIDHAERALSLARKSGRRRVASAGPAHSH